MIQFVFFQFIFLVEPLCEVIEEKVIFLNTEFKKMEGDSSHSGTSAPRLCIFCRKPGPQYSVPSHKKENIRSEAHISKIWLCNVCLGTRIIFITQDIYKNVEIILYTWIGPNHSIKQYKKRIKPFFKKTKTSTELEI